MRKHIVLLIISILVSVIGMAQSLVYTEEHELTQLLNPWTMLPNAAGLGVSPVKKHGVTELGYEKNNGNYHRAQLGNDLSGLNFYSERYDKLSKNWLVWGSFNFQMNRETDRAWSDVFFPFNNSPYIFGSSVKGNYDRQIFDLHAKLSTVQQGKFSWGVGVDYTAGDMSRLRDPRSRTYLADYAAIPSLTYKITEKHTLGLDVFARFQKEKMPNANTVQLDPNLKYYTFFGMENADAVIGAYNGFQRQFESGFYGGDIQFGYKADKMNWVNSLGMEYQLQEVTGSIKQSPGSYHSLNYKASSMFRLIQNNKLICASLKGNYYQGATNELRQELITVRDTATGIASQEWVTLYTYNNRYTTKSYNVDLDINIRDLMPDAKDYSWKAGADLQAYGFDNQYNLPYSEMKVDRLKAGIYGHARLMNKKNHRVNLDAKIDYDLALTNKLVLSDDALVTPTSASTTFQQGTYDIATQVLTPDNNYFSQNALSYKLEASYSFPLSFKKTQLVGFLKMYIKNSQTNQNQNWMNAGVSIGIIPL